MHRDLLNQNTNSVVTGLLEKTPHRVVNRLGELLKERGMSQGDLSRLTGIRVATINEIANIKKTNVNMLHLVPIMIALRITDMTEIFYVEFPDEVKERFAKDMEGYEGGLTEKMIKEVEENSKEMYVQEK
ncbi:MULTISPECIES: helix-turn-helix domain-containing protein [Bacillus cereus group]|uniref:Helix-turn-helix transcriptional regulator n=1 Tax=Bacillus tropicus TaxID=2026188 RepID=A0A5C4ZY90_9BACI|nr:MULTISPECIES: helix-turn-helix transcriptional regulator [Bacillus cereus group]PEZ18655.1 XRE family transcriptional regulator [Bacillus anthracis]MCU5201294.1 helix-turn-helix transcriptional regulator [Bacillus paranthracis]MDA1553054.1 helix-turn-helix transcriptional regulator [Bacillus cereus group sp. TH243-3LC]MDA1564057.1 helix-turn-helix transcriptional regulator [Bacillus cereus group sp. TH243-1LC]MDA1641780.1 helix-turn-helix transcriptional regulator [Bacillus cereus group sp.